MSTSPATRFEPGFNRRLMAYALGGSTLALTGAAHAAVVFSGIQNLSVTSTGLTSSVNVTARVNPSDATSTEFGLGFSTGSSNGLAVGAINSSNFSVLVPVNMFAVGQYNIGSTIGPVTPVGTPPFAFPKYLANGYLAFYDTTSGAWIASTSLGAATLPSNWSAGGTGYLGFRFGTGPYHYGWMQVTAPVSMVAGQTATVVQWAYESSDDTPITVGNTGSPVPEPGSIALVMAAGVAALLSQPSGFAAGAAGLRAWRRRRQRLS